MTKQELIDDPDSVWNKLGDDEPVFVLRAHDRFAPQTVREWASNVENFNQHNPPREKLQEAERCAVAMERWQDENGAKIPD